LIVFERLDTCREPERFAGWLLQIVRNQARNALVSRRLRDVPAPAVVRVRGLLTNDFSKGSYAYPRAPRRPP
jgi:DNA-directed RNA polymerase specialized sigma24 family protein